VNAIAISTDGSNVSDVFLITITNQEMLVSSITVSAVGGSTVINTANGTLQLSANILPANATNPGITWSILNGTGEASISTSGLVSAFVDGTVTARASATDGSNVYGDLSITISNQVIPVADVSIASTSGINKIDSYEETLQLSVQIVPENATDPEISWSIENGTGEASITNSGVVTPLAPGTVTAIASATDGSGTYDEFPIIISIKAVPVSEIIITSTSGLNTIHTPGGTLQLNAEVLPTDATVKDITWSINNLDGMAKISTDGLVTAIKDGYAIAVASSTDGSGVQGEFEILMSNQLFILVEDLTVSSEGNVEELASDNETLQIYADILPSNATDKRVIWNITEITGQAQINDEGLLTAVADGIIYVTASSWEDESISDYLVLTISGQVPDAIDHAFETISYRHEGGLLIFDNSSAGIKELRFYDLNGRLIQIHIAIPGENTIELNYLQQGLYIMKFLSDSHRYKNVILPIL
jgi:uncharacterized protein YjdB